MNQRYVSPQQFDELQQAIQRMEILGYGPEACVLEACKQIGIEPPRFEPVEIVVVNRQSTEKP